jgi:hypothetical protein
LQLDGSERSQFSLVKAIKIHLDTLGVKPKFGGKQIRRRFQPNFLRRAG